MPIRTSENRAACGAGQADQRAERWTPRLIVLSVVYAWLTAAVFLVVFVRNGDANEAIRRSFVAYEIAKLAWELAGQLLIGALALSHLAVLVLGALGTFALIKGAIEGRQRSPDPPRKALR